MTAHGIGAPLVRADDRRLLTGGGRYLDDIAFEAPVRGAVLRSPHAHARIAAIDTAEAARMPGVLAVLDGRDWEADGHGSFPCEDMAVRPDGTPMIDPPRPALVRDRVRFVGDPVAFVVAETESRAMDAAERIAVDYEPSPAVSTVQGALADGAPAVWPFCPDNVAFAHEEGDAGAVAAAFEGAAHIVRRRFAINRITGAMVEPRGCAGFYDPRDGRYTLHSGVQNAHTLRHHLAQSVFGVAESRVRVVCGDIGGSFGTRGANYPELILVLWASRKIGRAVKWVSSRGEGLATDDHARECLIDAALALDADGRFLAFQVSNSANLGAYLSTRGPRPPVGNLGTLAGVYRTPAVHVAVRGVHTHTTSTSPYRGSGAPEAAFALERLVDIAARRLAMDPAELRRINTVTPDRMPWTNALGHVYDCGDFPANLERALEAADHAGFPARRRAAEARGRLRGFGFANTVKKTSTPIVESAEIRVDPSGGLTLATGTVDHGQGHATIFRQILCECLGVSPVDIRFVQGDTDLVAHGRGTFNSRSTAIAGSAIRLAADKVIDKGKRIAAHMLEAAETDIAYGEARFAVAGTDRSVSLAEIAAAAAEPLPGGLEPGLDAAARYAPEYWNWPSSAQVCEVEIDPETGAVEIVAYAAISDAGRVINPMLYAGQLHGGIAQGIGQALLEEIRCDPESGQLLTGSFMDYALPRADDLAAFAVASAGIPTASNPIGAKGVGESGPTGALPATINAVADALAARGVADVPLPATPERIWRALNGGG
ncbi:MAG: xanthine dehydrogenase family protein molybdopterin-binding subunit [Defluviicoccus sp.]|nr:xanthine dehydrogenase family protein molybdopterin-binding subunit [Defluviicoccus sp.]MDE0386455.1 xanthine dehydrogenase family protein molybdopterin-binding subunit [Defluviicoccus sp.]